MATPKFRDEVFQGDTLQRAGFLLNRETQALEDLFNYTVTYSARRQGDSGSPVISQSATGAQGQLEVAPLVTIPADLPVGIYDAWLHIVAPSNTLVSTILGVLEVNVRPT